MRGTAQLEVGRGAGASGGAAWWRRRWPWTLACTAPLVFGLVATIRAAWVCDDAFITFRYVDQLEHGLGLVYNPGERVEAYTHFLWLVLIAALHRFGIDLVTLGRYLPILFHAATVAVLFLRTFRRGGARFAVPVAAWGVALHRDVQAYASSGLETAAFTFCTTIAVLIASASPLRAHHAAVACALASLFRPEGVLVTAVVGWFLLSRRADWRDVRRFAGLWSLLVLPLWLWRRFYYHDWLPNTFYAKAAAGANWSQGGTYVGLYFAVYPVLLLGLLAGIVASARAVRRGRAEPVVLCTWVSAALLLYVWRLGGDFMFGRFLVPITPLLYVAIEEMLQHRRGITAAAAAVVVVGSTLLAPVPRARILADPSPRHGIVDEQRGYTRQFIAARERQGEALRSTFAGLPVRVCIVGGQASLAYYARFPYVLEQYGLTDHDLARRPIAQRSRPGHERVALEADLIARGVHFRFRAAEDSLPGAVNEAQFGDLRAIIATYDRAFMDRLHGRPGVHFTDYPAYIDDLLPALDQMPHEKRVEAWMFFASHYFAHNDDPERLGRAREAFTRAGVPVSAAEPGAR